MLLASIHRYPVKSLQGEDLAVAELNERGLLGDRACALLDVETGRVASAKNPRRWPSLLELSAVYLEPTEAGRPLPRPWITLGEGQRLDSSDEKTGSRLTEILGRPVRVLQQIPRNARTEGYWPDEEWLEQRGSVFEFEFPEGTFFDGATLHLLTTASLRSLEALSPGSVADPRRFRPNLVVEASDEGFPEQEWLGRMLALGTAVLRIDRPTPRCVMTTVEQCGLPKDPAILKTLVQREGSNLGVYATVVKPGRVERGAEVRFV